MKILMSMLDIWFAISKREVSAIKMQSSTVILLKKLSIFVLSNDFYTFVFPHHFRSIAELLKFIIYKLFHSNLFKKKSLTTPKISLYS